MVWDVEWVGILLWVSILPSPSVLPGATSPICLGQGRQASLRELGRGNAPSAYSRQPLAPLRRTSEARLGTHPGCEMGPLRLSWPGGSVT